VDSVLQHQHKLIYGGHATELIRETASAKAIRETTACRKLSPVVVAPAAKIVEQS